MRFKDTLISLSTLFMLVGCSNNNSSNIVKVVDFSDFSQNDVVAWSLENNVVDKINYLFENNLQINKGMVISQSIKPGTDINKKFDVIISSGDTTLSPESSISYVPNVVGFTLNDARTKLTNQGYEITDTIYETSYLTKDTILYTNPLPGERIINKKISLHVSNGTIENGKVIIIVDTPFVALDESYFNISVKFDGVEQKRLRKSVLTNVQKVEFTLHGSGQKEVEFLSNGRSFARYSVNFDNGEYAKK